MLVLNFPAFENRKYAAYDRFLGNWETVRWQNPDQDRTNMNARIYLKTTLPYNIDMYYTAFGSFSVVFRPFVQFVEFISFAVATLLNAIEALFFSFHTCFIQSLLRIYSKCLCSSVELNTEIKANFRRLTVNPTYESYKNEQKPLLLLSYMHLYIETFSV